MGSLGNVYEQTQQWTEAEKLTQQAVQLAQQINAGDISYLWQWQLGRVMKGQGRWVGKFITMSLRTERSLLAFPKGSEVNQSQGFRPFYISLHS